VSTSRSAIQNGLHVILRAFHALHEFAIHAVFLAIMARLLFRPFVPTLRAIFALREAK
jgi:hypothetical protein